MLPWEQPLVRNPCDTLICEAKCWFGWLTVRGGRLSVMIEFRGQFICNRFDNAIFSLTSLIRECHQIYVLRWVCSHGNLEDKHGTTTAFMDFCCMLSRSVYLDIYLSFMANRDSVMKPLVGSLPANHCHYSAAIRPVFPTGYGPGQPLTGQLTVDQSDDRLQ